MDTRNADLPISALAFLLPSGASFSFENHSPKWINRQEKPFLPAQNSIRQTRRPRFVCCNVTQPASDRVITTQSSRTFHPDGRTPFGEGTLSQPLVDEDNEPRLHVVFVHPQIHWNTVISSHKTHHYYL